MNAVAMIEVNAAKDIKTLSAALDAATPWSSGYRDDVARQRA